MHSANAYFALAMSLLANGSFLYVMFSTDNSQIGSYRILLTSFAINDVVMSIQYVILLPACIQGQGRFLFVPLSLKNYDEWIGSLSISILIINFYESTILLIFHYVYRLCVISKPLGPHYSPVFWFIFCVIVNLVYVLPFGTLIFFVPSDIERAGDILLFNNSYGLSAAAFPGYLDFTVSGSHEKLLIYLGLSVYSYISAFLIVGCIIGIVVTLKKSMSSTATKKMHRHLFRSLLVQSAVPVLCCYVPLTATMLGPLFGIDLGVYVDLVFPLSSAFPILDPLLLMFYINIYRKSLVLKFRKIFKKASTSPAAINAA